MAPTSHLLKQHILTIEHWIEATVMTNAHFKVLENQGCKAKNGIIITDPETGVSFTPSSIMGDFILLPTAQSARVGELLMEYSALLKDLDPAYIQYALELDERRLEYETTAIQEIMDKRGILWMRNNEGIFKIKILDIIDKVNFRKIEFENLSSLTKERKCLSLRFVKLFLTKEDAYNPLKEGYHEG